MKSHDSRIQLFRVMVGMLIAASCSSCWIMTPKATSPVSIKGPGKILFSPDSSKLAFFWQEYWTDMSMNQELVKRKVHIYWCDTKSPGKRKRIKLGTQGKEARTWGHSVPGDFLFSPDGNHIAVGYCRMISLIELKTGKKKEIIKKGETPSVGFKWVNEHELAYGRISEQGTWGYYVYNVPEGKKRFVDTDRNISYPQQRGGPLYATAIEWVNRYQGDKLNKELDKQDATGEVLTRAFFRIPIPSWVGMRESTARRPATFCALRVGDDGKVQAIVPLIEARARFSTWTVSPDGHWFATLVNDVLLGPKLKLHEIDIPLNGGNE